MYEVEVNARKEPSQQLAGEVLSAFTHSAPQVLARTVLAWGEHCTECAWPGCYSTCELYSAREDGKCRRFVDGMVRIECPSAINSYILKIKFKRWAKLWARGTLHLYDAAQAKALETRDYRIGTILYHLPLPTPVKRRVITARYSQKKRNALHVQKSAELPDCFLLECFNPSNQELSLSLSIRTQGGTERLPFQKLLAILPGFQTIRVPFEEMYTTIDFSGPFNIELIPNAYDEQALYFGLMEFVREVERQSRPSGESQMVKCVVWDLDHTLWEGVLVEDGAAHLELKPGIKKVIEALDRHGILQSIASKNNHEEAMHLLTRLGVAEFFLYPQIGWSPKSVAIQAIAKRLNIGMNSLLFVDDSEFELEEVRRACVGVKVLNAQHYGDLARMNACAAPVTEESINRRKSYQVEQVRQELAQDFGGDYKAFLKDCDIHVHLSHLTTDNLKRVHELTQRTNQMNFSGTRYSCDVLQELMKSPNVHTYVVECKDRFGSYGTVGFAVVDNNEPRLTDMMFSCRIQSKRVEHAVLSYLLRKYSVGGRVLRANYKKTARNAPAGRVFADLGMQEIGTANGVTCFTYPGGVPVPDDGIITVGWAVARAEWSE